VKKEGRIDDLGIEPLKRNRRPKKEATDLRFNPRNATGGPLLAWTIYREGPAAKHLCEDLDATLRPYLTHGVERPW
jgi:hypothetical protein